MTTSAKPWDLGLGTSTGGPSDYVPGVSGLTYSEPVDPVEEFGFGPYRVVIKNPRADFSYVTSSPGQGRIGEGPLRTVVFEDRLLVAGGDQRGLVHLLPVADTYPTQSDVLEAIEGLRTRLNLHVETTARLLGVEKRTYQGWKSGEQPMPIPRLQTAVNALVALGRLAADDPAAAKKVLEDESAEATKLVATGQFVALRALIDRASAVIARETAAVNPAIDAPLALPDGVDAQRALGQADSGEFRAMIAYLERLAPETHATTTVWKVLALIGLQAAVERLSLGDQLGDDWLFLVAMNGPTIAAFEERAQVLLRSVNTTEETWKAFIDDGATQAWASYSVPVAEPAEKGSHDPSASARPVDLYEFSHFGFDLATGRVREIG